MQNHIYALIRIGALRGCGADKAPHLAPSFFEKVQIGSSGGPEFWAIWKVRDPQDLIFKTPNRGPESPLPSQKSERPSGPHF